MPVPPLPTSALRDLLGVLRTLWWVRWAAAAEEGELLAIASAGDDVRRLVRGAQFEACVTTWHQARLAMKQVVRLGEVVPEADMMLRAGARRVLAVPGIPAPPPHAFAAPTGERPPGETRALEAGAGETKASEAQPSARAGREPSTQETTPSVEPPASR